MQENHRDDEGIAMLMALSIMGIVIAISLVAVQIAIGANRDSGVDRQRLTAVNAAEAGIDQTYALLQTSGVLLPCQGPTGTLTAASDQPTFSVTVQYFDASGAPITCSGSTLTSAQVPSTAMIQSTATTPQLSGAARTTQRVMQSLVRLTPIRADGFNNAIYGYAGINVTNQATVTGNNGADANLYTNGDFLCNNKQTYAGSVISQGKISFQQTCSAQGDLWAAKDVMTTNNSSIGGKVLTSGGNVALSGNTSVVGVVKAAGSISWNGCTSAKCISGATDVQPPPSQNFPKVYDTADTQADWANNGGFTTILTGPPSGGVWNCSATNATNPSNWIVQNASSLSGPTQLHTSCRIAWDNIKNVSLNNDLAIFAAGGFSSVHQATWKSTNPNVMRRMYWIVPYSDSYATNACSAPSISTDNNYTTDASVDMMLYSQGPIVFSNLGQNVGQIYSACTVTINNNFNLQYHPLPMFGVSQDNLPAQAYAVDVSFKREVR